MDTFIAGSVVTVLVAWFFYLLGKRDAAELLRQTTISLRALESAGLVELNRDRKGKIIGIVHHASLGDSAPASDSASSLKPSGDLGARKNP